MVQSISRDATISFLLVSVLAVTGAVGTLWAVPPQYESPHIRPLAVTQDRILAVNTPDNRLSIFDWNGGSPILEREVRVGLEPIAVVARGGDEAWVVNHLSDDVTIVNAATGTVLATVSVGDEPTQVIFVPDPTSPGAQWAAVVLSQEDRVVFHETNPPYARVTEVAIPGADPRTLVADLDGSGLWVAVFESGNRTTLVPRWLVPEGPWSHLNPPLPPIVPPMNPTLPPPPPNSVVVRNVGGSWLDEQGGNWNGIVTWDVSDVDLAHIDLAGGSPAVDRTVTGVGTLLYDLTIDPAGDLWVVNTEALNDILFEPKVSGIGVENNITHVPSSTWTPVVHSLNFTEPSPGARFIAEGSAARREALTSPVDYLAIPSQVLHSTIGGAPELYVTAIGGNQIAVVDPATGAVSRRLPVPEGLTGLAEAPGGAALVAVNRLQNTLHLVDPGSGAVGSPIPIGASGFDPTPPALKNGRRFLYTGSHSQFGSFACASCHPHAHFDAIAWDLGNPLGNLQQLPPEENGGVVVPPFHPMKGPMATQSLRGIASTGPLHWRGDRADFTRFNPAFVSLLGGDSLSTTDMIDFRDFILAVRYPPNPWLDHLDEPPATMPNGGDPVLGEQLFFDPQAGGCSACHVPPRGTSGIVIEVGKIRFGTEPIKVPHLRNLTEKLGFASFFAPDNRRGFGFFHDGFDPDLWEFEEHQALHLQGWQLPHFVAYVLAFPSDTHGGVGRQVTVDPGFPADPVRQARLAEILQSAATGSVDLIAHGATPEGERGWFRVGLVSGAEYQSDRMGETWGHDELVNAAVSGELVATFTVVPLGQGIRMGVDRDEDGYYDRTELDLGSDPADPTSVPAVSVEGDAGIDGAMSRVLGAHPQPFEIATTIELYLAAPDRVRLRIYDVNGRCVRDLVAGAFPRGKSLVTWDGRDDRGGRVPQGIYVARLETSRGSSATKIVRL